MSTLLFLATRRFPFCFLELSPVWLVLCRINHPDPPLILFLLLSRSPGSTLYSSLCVNLTLCMVELLHACSLHSNLCMLELESIQFCPVPYLCFQRVLIRNSLHDRTTAVRLRPVPFPLEPYGMMRMFRPPFLCPNSACTSVHAHDTYVCSSLYSDPVYARTVPCSSMMCVPVSFLFANHVCNRLFGPFINVRTIHTNVSFSLHLNSNYARTV